MYLCKLICIVCSVVDIFYISLQTVSNDIYWYYLLELGYYISYIYMLFTDHKRKVS